MIFFLLYFFQQNFDFFSNFSTNQSKLSDLHFIKQPNHGSFSYFCKYLGTIKRKNPDKNNKTNQTIINSQIHIIHQQSPYICASNTLNSKTINGTKNVSPKENENFIQDENDNKGTLVESQYYPLEDNEKYSINNLFNKDDTNYIYSNKDRPISADNPFIIFVDMGEIINANMITIFGCSDGQYLPKKFVLYGRIDKDNLEIFADVDDAPIIDIDVIVSFDKKSFKYYKLIVTDTYATHNTYISYRCAKFSIKYPMSTPIPERTQYPDANTAYINKVLNESDFTDQNFTGKDNIKQISGCRFTNIHKINRNYYIRIENDIMIFDNIFENTELITQDGIPGVIWNNYNGSITISNCSFIRISGRGGEGYVYTSNPRTISHAIFDRCVFIDCGKVGDMQLISVLNEQSSIKFYSCKFSFSTSPRTCGVLDIRTNDCVFDNCQFICCYSNAILLSNRAVAGQQTIGTFEFTNNKVKNNHGKFIKAVRMMTKPIIENNTFESTTLDGDYYIQIPHNQLYIEINNNTFTEIVSIGNQYNSRGGIGIFMENNDSEFTIKYHECKFYNIINDQSSYPNCQGGCIQYGLSTYSNINCHIEITKCIFKNNKAKLHGGAIAIRTIKSVLIQECEFSNNIANNINNNAELLFTNNYDTNTNGFGGAIYINPTFNYLDYDYEMISLNINSCTFRNNRAYQGYAIYLEGENSSTTISITNNIFDGNSCSETDSNQGCIICSEITSLDKEYVINSNTFTNIGTTEKFDYADHSNTPIVTSSPTPERTQYPGTNTAYINKVFNTIDDQIQAGKDDIKQICGCSFTNIISTTYIIKIFDEVLIFDNIFENANSNRPEIFTNDYSGKITLTNCKFIQVSNIFTSNDQHQIQLTIEKCDFIDCNPNEKKHLISLFGVMDSIKFYSSKFSFGTSNQTFGVLYIRTNDCVFDNCQFICCYSNAILLSNEVEDGEQPIGTFEFTNNKVKNNHGKFIKAVRMLTKPIIENNTSESTTLDGDYYIQIPHNQLLIEINNNTFTEIISIGNQFNSRGGIGLFMENNDSEFTIKYHECKFYNIINDQSSYPNCQGGCIQYGLSTNSNINCHIEITKCIFKNNKAQLHGGAIAIRTTKSVLIQECEFSNNIANNINNNAELLFVNPCSDNTNGFGTRNKLFEYVSHACTPTASNNFTFSNEFTNSDYFTSHYFSQSDYFTISYIFSSSNIFTLSDIFTSSNSFSFSPSNDFTNSNVFTLSNAFTNTNIFSLSEKLNPILNPDLTSKKQTISFIQSLIWTMKKSVSYSASYIVSNSLSITYYMNSYIETNVETGLYEYFPYVIYFLSPSYVPIQIQIELREPKKKITQEQLIGFICGGTAVFFLILGIIIMIVRKAQMKGIEYGSDYLLSDSSYNNNIETNNNGLNTNEISEVI